MIKLVLVRHGKSVWNLENKFTGWADVDLCDIGIEEAKKAGKLLKEKGFSFDLAYTSNLKRTRETLDIILSEMNIDNIEIRSSAMLNERHYGALQGLNKDDVRKEYGEKQVKIWRRGITERPPLLTKDDPRYVEGAPLGENLLDTEKRVAEYFEKEIKKELLNGRKIIMTGHGNSFRALIKHLDKLSNEDVINLEVKTGKPVVYEFDDELHPIRHYYLGEEND